MARATDSANTPDKEAKVRRLVPLRLHAFDIGAEHEEFFIDVFVAAVDVIEAADFGGAFGG